MEPGEKAAALLVGAGQHSGMQQTMLTDTALAAALQSAAKQLCMQEPAAS